MPVLLLHREIRIFDYTGFAVFIFNVFTNIICFISFFKHFILSDIVMRHAFLKMLVQGWPKYCSASRKWPASPSLWPAEGFPNVKGCGGMWPHGWRPFFRKKTIFTGQLYSCIQYNFKWPVTLSTRSAGAGPTPRTVFEPGAIWVRPASLIRLVTSPISLELRATASSSTSSSHRTTTLAWPQFSHSSNERGSWIRLCL